MQNKKLQNNPTTDLEYSYLRSSYKRVIGIDEAGRGSWAGPIAFGAYCFDLKDQIIPTVKDSKLLSPLRRENILADLDKERYKHVFIENYLIDQIGMSEVIRIGIKKLISMFEPKESIFLIDGNYKLDLNVEYKSLIKGDKLHYSIACASIVAKVKRDKLMDQYAKEYPIYRFELNKGYGTSLHHKALIQDGICKLHRASFKPIKEIIKKKS